MTDTAPATFEPDWDALDREAGRWLSQEGLEAVVSEYERQRAEAGWVSVRREDLLSVRNGIASLADWQLGHGECDIDNELRGFIRALDFLAVGTMEDTSAPDDEIDPIREPWGPAR